MHLRCLNPPWGDDTLPVVPLSPCPHTATYNLTPSEAWSIEIQASCCEITSYNYIIKWLKRRSRIGSGPVHMFTQFLTLGELVLVIKSDLC